jgi:hypothetical protein
MAPSPNVHRQLGAAVIRTLGRGGSDTDTANTPLGGGSAEKIVVMFTSVSVGCTRSPGAGSGRCRRYRDRPACPVGFVSSGQ